MTDLINYINQQITDCIEDVTVFGICQLVEESEGHYPCSDESEATRIAPDDHITIYHRLLDGNLEKNEDLSFGRQTKRQNKAKVRMVVFINMDEDESLIDDIINALPGRFNVSGYQYCNLSEDIDLIKDRKRIWVDEFGGVDESRYQKRYRLYAVEYSLEYIKCKVCEITSP